MPFHSTKGLAGVLYVLLLVSCLPVRLWAQDKMAFRDWAKNPVVLAPGGKGEWDAGALGSMTVVKVGQTFHMYYEAWGVRGKELEDYNSLQIGHATSKDGLHWVKDPANPVVAKGGAGAWDADGTWDPYVLYEDGQFKMWYGGGMDQHCDWGYAVSADGVHFEKKGRISHLGNVEDDHIVHDSATGRYYLYYWDRKFEPSGLFRAASPDETHFDFAHAMPVGIDGVDPKAMYKFTHVIKNDGQWLMFFGKFVRPGCKDSRTGLATSPDGLHWTVRNDDLLTGIDGEALRAGDSSWIIYYGKDGFFDEAGQDIRAAVYKGRLKDLGGVTFEDYAENPVVLTPGTPGEWDAGAVGSVSVVKAGETYHMYYEAWGKLSDKGTEEEYETLQIGHATSTDGIHWKKDPANPVIRKGKKRSWSQEGVWDPFILYEHGLFKLWYGCSDGGKTNWAYAVSRDGSHFEGNEQISHLGNVEDDHVVHDTADGKYYMFYWDRAAAPWDSVMKGGDHQPSGLFVAVSDDETHFDFEHAVRIQVEGQQWPVKYSHVIQDGDEWVMFYGQAVTRGNSSSTGVAVSRDLIHWRRKAFPVVKGHDAEVLKTGEDAWYLYYAPDRSFDMPGADVRLATYRGKLSGFFKDVSQPDFGGFYTRVDKGMDWEEYSRTGKFADIIVRLPEGELVFWRGNSYLPYWKTARGQWDLEEVVRRSGDGAGRMPDKVNTYSHVEIIGNTSSEVVVHWRYLANFTAGNPHGNISPDNFVDEVFTITPDGRVRRDIRKGTQRIDDWNDPLNRTVEVLHLDADGITRISRANPRHSALPARVKGNPPRGAPPVPPVLSFSFDEGVGDQVKETITKTSLPVAGSKTYWKKGISGTALEFDGYNTAVAFPAERVPDISGSSLTVEGWFALGAYPWNWAPLVQQGDDEGFFLGVDSHGYPGFMIKVDGVWQQLTVPNKPPYDDADHLALFRWYHMAGVYDKQDGMMRLYIDGKEVISKRAGKGGIQAARSDVRLGKAGVPRTPTEGTHDTHPSEFGIDGLIDEVRIYSVALRKEQIAGSFAGYKISTTIKNGPDMQRRNLPAATMKGKFKAKYMHLPYYETWDNLFRFGPYPDVVVGFDQLPTKFVFWRGVSFIPMMVNESGQWFTQEFNETGGDAGAPGDCEPMSDKPSLESHVRVIESNNARVVVEWRYRLANPDHNWAHYDSVTGWGDIADWLFYIYPDGAASVVMRCYSSKPDAFFEWNEQIAVLGPGQHPEKVLRRTPVMTLVDSAGKATAYDWNPDPPRPRYAGNKIQMIHFTGRYNPFAIQNFNGGHTYSDERTWYSVFPTWNHWPIGQVNSSGRTVSFPDRAAHSSISNLFWPLYAERGGKAPFREKLLMEGMTDLPADSLVGLADSWLTAPPVVNLTGGVSEGYDQAHRAYGFSAGETPLVFDIAASRAQPIHNLCFEVRNWKARDVEAGFTIDGIAQMPGPAFRQSVNIDTDGTYTLIIWAQVRADKPVKFEITNKN